MPWYEILALSLAVWLVGSVLLALVFGGVVGGVVGGVGAHQREDGAAQLAASRCAEADRRSRHPHEARAAGAILYRRARNRRSGIDRRWNVAPVTIERRSGSIGATRGLQSDDGD